MYDAKLQKFKLDYVYKPVDAETLQSVAIESKVMEDYMVFEMTSEVEMKKEDIMCVINGVQRDSFNRIKISIVKDCKVLYKQADKVFEVVFDEAGEAVAEVTPL